MPALKSQERWNHELEANLSYIAIGDSIVYIAVPQNNNNKKNQTLIDLLWRREVPSAHQGFSSSIATLLSTCHTAATAFMDKGAIQ